MHIGVGSQRHASAWRPALVLAASIAAVGVLAQSMDPNPSRAQAVRESTADRDVIASRAGGIVGSKHDFSAAGAVPRDLCLPCHTPHITAAEAPLLVARPAATQPVRAYQTALGDLNAASLICLSCHDGVVAPDVYAGQHAMTWSERSASGLDPGKVRLTSHPVGVPYPAGDPKYESASAVTSDGRIKLPDGRIQCTTCHDPHNTERHAGLLVRSNERSRLCLSCHRL